MQCKGSTMQMCKNVTNCVSFGDWKHQWQQIPTIFTEFISIPDTEQISEHQQFPLPCLFLLEFLYISRCEQVVLKQELLTCGPLDVVWLQLPSASTSLASSQAWWELWYSFRVLLPGRLAVSLYYDRVTHFPGWRVEKAVCVGTSDFCVPGF